MLRACTGNVIQEMSFCNCTWEKIYDIVELINILAPLLQKYLSLQQMIIIKLIVTTANYWMYYYCFGIQSSVLQYYIAMLMVGLRIILMGCIHIRHMSLILCQVLISWLRFAIYFAIVLSFGL